MVTQQINTMYEYGVSTYSVEDCMYVAMLGVPLTVVSYQLAAAWVLAWLFVIPYTLIRLFDE